MKFWPILLLLTCCHAVIPPIPKNLDDFGTSVTFQKQNELGMYDFGYSEGHPSGASFRRESGDAFGNKVGSYGIKVSDGSFRTVYYTADSNGFRANIISNEPGVAPQNPASATIFKPPVLPFNAAPVAPVAPVAFPPPPPPPPVPVRAPVVVPPKIFQPIPVSYNYIAPAQIAVPPPPPPAYFPPKYPAPVPPPAPVAVAPVAKGVAAFPPPPSAYFTNLGPGKGYANYVRTYPSLYPPLTAVPPQYNYLSLKSPPPYQGFTL